MTATTTNASTIQALTKSSYGEFVTATEIQVGDIILSPNFAVPIVKVWEIKAREGLLVFDSTYVKDDSLVFRYKNQDTAQEALNYFRAKVREEQIIPNLKDAIKEFKVKEFESKQSAVFDDRLAKGGDTKAVEDLILEAKTLGLDMPEEIKASLEKLGIKS